MKKKKFLTTGEFAALCKCTKATLFHYDREGLLKPRHVRENGYRYYGVEQFFDFDMIATLKDTGSSLKEIKDCLHNTDGAEFLVLLEEKLRVVKGERARLARREAMLRDMAVHVREALDFEYGVFRLEEQPEERFEAVATKGTVEDSMADFVERFAEYINYYKRQERVPRSPFGVILDWADAERGHYLERYYFSRATRSTPHELLLVKAAGKYAVLAHKGTTETHLQAVEGLARDMRKAGLTAMGNCFCYDMMSYVLLGPHEMYAAKYCVRVK